MAVNMKLGVDLGGFKSGINEGKAILKGLNAEMKSAEAEFKKTGNSEQLMANKTKTLNSQIEVQKGIVDKAKKALQEMDKAGIQPTDKAYQQMYTTMMQAQAGMYETQAALQSLTASEQAAAGGADQLTNSVNSIGKKMSLDQVITGIGKITDGLEAAAQKAIRLGENIWNQIIDTAAWSDNVNTLADRLGLTPERVQQMMIVADEFEAPVEMLGKTWKKVRMNMSSDSEEVMDAFLKVGAAMNTTINTGFGYTNEIKMISNDYMDVFWKIGESLMNMTDLNEQERLAQKLLGRSWDELIPLFKKGRKEYEAALDAQEVAAAEAIQNNADLKDSVSALEEQFNVFKADVLGKISPELTKVTESFGGLLTAITDYINTPQGQELLSGIGDAISSLIDDLTKIDPESVVNGFVDVVTGLVDGLKYVVKNKDTIINAVRDIVIGWAGLKLAGGALDILKLISGLKGLGNGNANGVNVVTEGEQGQPGTVGTTTQTKPIIEKLVNGMAVKSVLDQAFQILDDAMAASNEATTARDWEIGMQRQKLMRGEISQEEYENQESRINDLYDKLDEIVAKKGPVEIPATLVVMGVSAGGKMGTTSNGWFSGGGGGGPLRYIMSADGFANGLPYVPYDGFLAALHKGERVVPAREISSRNFSSNLYVESMIMNNGADAEGLASAMAAAQRRTMSGYGS